jgi:RNA polymerase sigma factor (sigma-70 family)
MGQEPSSETRPSLLLRIRDAEDVQAWQTFVDIYGPLIYGFSKSKGLQDEDASDVSQQVLLAVHGYIDTYDSAKGRFRDWLGTITRNEIGRVGKKLARRPKSADNSNVRNAIEAMSALEQDTEWTEAFDVHVFQKALSRIRGEFNENTWRAFERAWIDDVPSADVAAELDRPIGWVYKAKSKVVNRLEEEVRLLSEDSILHGR